MPKKIDGRTPIPLAQSGCVQNKWHGYGVQDFSYRLYVFLSQINEVNLISDRALRGGARALRAGEG